MNEDDRNLLNILQEGIQPVSRPFHDVAEKLNLTEEEILKRLQKLLDSGLVRKFGAIIAPKKMGYVSTLAAASIPEDKIESAVELINSYKGVTHNYEREGDPNVWFTMTEQRFEQIEKNLKEIEEKIGTEILMLPATRTYKIGVKHDL